jgi:hypothetical protein
MSELKLPYRDPKRPPFRRDPSFRPLCYEFRVTVSRPEWVWSAEELRECNDLPRQESGILLSYRESGRSHTIVWCRPDQWHQWKNVSLFGDGLPGMLDRSKVDRWSHRDFCMLLAAEFLKGEGHYLDFPSDDFSPVLQFSPQALDIWTAVDPLGESGRAIFGEGFTPSKNAGGLH